MSNNNNNDKSKTIMNKKKNKKNRNILTIVHLSWLFYLVDSSVKSLSFQDIFYTRIKN